MSKDQESIVMKGFVELDDAFIAAKTPGGKKNNKQGRGTITKSSVLVLAETSDINTKKTKYAKHSAFRKVRFIVSNDLKSNSIVKNLKNKILNCIRVNQTNYDEERKMGVAISQIALYKHMFSFK